MTLLPQYPTLQRGQDTQDNGSIA